MTSPAITQLYLDWGVASKDQKARINSLLSRDSREQLWKSLHGKIPRGALDAKGHHAGQKSP